MIIKNYNNKFKNFIYNNISVLNKLYLFLVTISLSIFIFENINHLANFQIVLSSKKAMAVVNILTIICLFVHLIEDKKKFLLSVVLLTFSYLIYKFSPIQNNYYLNFVKISIAYSLCKPHFIIRVALFSLFISVLLVFSLYFSELTDKEIYALRDGFVRNAFGFGHPNGTGSFILALSLLFWCSFKGKFSNLVSIVIFLSAYLLISSYIDSRTNEILCIASAGFALIYVAVISILHDKIKSYLLIISQYICISGLSILSIGYLLFCYFYNPEIDIYRELNDLLSTRIQLTHDGLIRFGISLWGSIVQFADINPTGFESVKTVSYNYLDSLFVYVPICHGIFALILLNIAYIIVVRKAFIAGYHRIGITLFILSIYSISESFFIQIAANIFIYLLLIEFEKNRKISIEEFYERVLLTCKKLKSNFLSADLYINRLYKKIIPFVYGWLSPLYTAIKSYILSIVRFNLVKNDERFGNTNKKQQYESFSDNFIEVNSNSIYDKLKSYTNNNLTLSLKETLNQNKSLYIYSVLFFALIAGMFGIMFSDIVSYSRTVINLKEHYSIKPIVISIVAVLLFTSLFIKSIFEIYLFILCKYLFKRKCISLKFDPVFTALMYIIFTVSLVSISFTAIISEAEKRKSDIVFLSKISNQLNDRNIDYDLYVDKVPYLFKGQDIKVNNQLLNFDQLALNDRPQLLITKPDDMHFMLTMYGYKFTKISDSMAIFVKDQNLINVLTDNSIKLSDRYYFKKNVPTERIAQLNKLRVKNKQSISLKSMECVFLENTVFMPAGNYNLSLTIKQIENEEIQGGNLGIIQLTASNGHLILHSKEFSKEEFVNGTFNYTIPLHVDWGYHNVDFKMYLYRGLNAYIESVVYEKVDN